MNLTIKKLKQFLISNKHIRTFTFLFNTLFSNIRLYLFCFILPAVITYLLFFTWSRYSYELLLPPIVFNFIFITILFTSFYVSVVVFEWRKNNFFFKMKLYDISKTNILVSVLFINFIIFFLAFCFNLVCFSIYGSFSKFYKYKIYLQNLKWYIWIILLLISFISSSALQLINLVAIFIIKNTKLLLLILYIGLLYNFIFSDITIIPNVSSSFMPMIIISYLSPLKYIAWCNYIIASYGYIDWGGIYQVINDKNNFISFNNFFVPFSIEIAIVAITLFLYYKWFVWSFTAEVK